jgi:uncharacterized membrane protein (DUF106 family)
MYLPVHIINSILTKVFDILFLPFRVFPPVWAMIAISCLTGLLMLWVFKLVSNQAAIKTVKDRIKGNLLAVRIYQYDIRVVVRSQLRVLRHTLTYMKHSLFPMLVTIVPVVLIVVQIHLWFSVQPLEVGKGTLLKVKVRESSSVQQDASLEAPDGVSVETPPVRIPGESEIAWRIGASADGLHTLTVHLGEESVEKQVAVGTNWGPVSAVRTGKGPLQSLLYPAEKPIPAESQIESIQVHYPSLPLSVLGWEVHWLVLFFALSVGFGFLLKGLFGIEV